MVIRFTYNALTGRWPRRIIGGAKTAIFAAISTVAPAAAQDTLVLPTPSPVIQTLSEAVPLPLAEVEQRLRAHPSLTALALSADANRERADAALGLPDPTVSLMLNNVPLLNPSLSEYLPSNKAVGVTQALPSRSTRKAKSLTELRRAREREAAAAQLFASLRGDLLSLLIDKDSTAKQRDIARKKSAFYDALEDIIDIEISADRADVASLNQIDIERMAVKRTLADLDGQEAALDAQLIALVGLVPQTPLPTLSPRVWSGGALDFHAVRVADASVEISDAGVQIAEADFKADWGVNLTYQQRESGRGARSNFDGDDWVSGGVTFTVPLWANRKQAPNLRAAQSERHAAMARRMATARAAQSEWARYDAAIKAAQDTLQILQDTIIARQAQMDVLLVGYESGQGDYAPILRSEIAVLSLRAEILKIQARRDQMIAKMNSLIINTEVSR